MGSATVSDEMWPLAQSLLAGSTVVTVKQIADAVKCLADRCRVIAEGAGAASLAAALAGNIEAGRIVCIVSGGNIDSAKLSTILAGNLP